MQRQSKVGVVHLHTHSIGDVDSTGSSRGCLIIVGLVLREKELQGLASSASCQSSFSRCSSKVCDCSISCAFYDSTVRAEGDR